MIGWDLKCQYRQTYANQTGLDILKCRNDKELSSLIFQRFTDKYLFFKNDELWDISKVMLEYVSTDFEFIEVKAKKKKWFYYLPIFTYWKTAV